MRDIAYDWNDAVHVMTAGEIASAEAHFRKADLVMADIDKVTADRERMEETMRRARERQGATVQKEAIVWHIRRDLIPCEGEPSTTLCRSEFARRMSGTRTLVCHKCLHYYQNYTSPSRNKARAKHTPYFDKYADAHAPVDVMSK